MSKADIPKRFAAGTTFAAEFEVPAYADGWDAVLYLRGPGAINLEAAAVVRRAVIRASAEDTAEWQPGEYSWSLRVTDGADVAQVSEGRITVTPDVSALPAGAETRSQNRIAYDAICAVLAKRATMDQERYRINNRELYRTSIADLMKLKAHYRQLVAEECGGSRRGRIGSIRVGFGPIGR